MRHLLVGLFFFGRKGQSIKQWNAVCQHGITSTICRTSILGPPRRSFCPCASSSSGYNGGDAHGNMDIIRDKPHISTIATSDRDAFLFGLERISFASYGINEDLSAALAACGKHYATTIQAKAFVAITNGQDVVMGSETGSGKTLAYLVPIINQLLESNDHDHIRQYPRAVVMCPNKELAAQVHRMATEVITGLKDEGRQAVVAGLHVQQLDQWPRFGDSVLSPSIVVCTPAFLAHFIKGPNILEPELFRNVRHLVLDEADMLLEGSYLKDVEKIIEAFRLIRREMINDGIVNINAKVLQTVLVAATLPSFGLRSIDNYIAKRFPTATRISNDYLHKHHPRIQQQFIEVADDVLSPVRMDLLVGAIHSIGDDRMTVLRDVEINAPALPASLQTTELVQTMVFVNTAEVARQISQGLQDRGIINCEYHNMILEAEKQNSLKRFRENEVPLLVCTDHAARGLDLPNVRHVVQAEFALNVVQHLHRVGRASRAGVQGKATNFYDSRSKDLVQSILSDSTGQNKVDQSFSRRRGFRAKLKKVARRDIGESSTK